jgi:predicted component of type VI protein secretion system
MFGHQDDSAMPTPPAEPVADGILSNNDDGITLPAPPPMAPEPSTPDSTPTVSTAPAIDDSAANDYIMTSAPRAHGNSTPPVDGNNKSDNLLSIKQQALQQLSPLVDHLEQSAEEKFRTTMMMIQASDDQSLIPVAYDAAKEITDEKARAQALLDVVNEINYFTQPPTT